MKLKWYETPVADRYYMKGLATILVAKRLFQPIHIAIPANDRSHIPW